jgi:hypothetical protein
MFSYSLLESERIFWNEEKTSVRNLKARTLSTGAGSLASETRELAG